MHTINMILQLAHFQDDLADEDVMLLDTGAEVRRRNNNNDIAILV